MKYDDLPTEIKRIIASNLTKSELAKFAQVNRESSFIARDILKERVSQNPELLEAVFDKLTSDHSHWLASAWTTIRRCKAAMDAKKAKNKNYDQSVRMLALSLRTLYKKHKDEFPSVFWRGLFGMYTSLKGGMLNQPAPSQDWKGPEG